MSGELIGSGTGPIGGVVDQSNSFRGGRGPTSSWLERAREGVIEAHQEGERKARTKGLLSKLTPEIFESEWARRSLRKFVQLLWPVLEPKRTFIQGWAVDAVCEHLQAVTDGQIRRLLINVPPGCMKSLTTSVFWPAWEWGPRRLPHMRFVAASYSERLTIRDNRKCRQLIQSPEYRRRWGNQFELSEEQNAKTRYDNDKTGWRIATSVLGLGTGERGDRFIIDDPHNVMGAESELKRDAVLQWFSEVVPTRLNDPDESAIVVIMQRVHERDVSGLILGKELGYDHLCLPMEFEPDHPTISSTALGFVDPRKNLGELLWPERFSSRHLEVDLKPVLRSWGGEYAISGQLQQRPAPRGGGLFKKSNFEIVDHIPKGILKRVRGWDLAATVDDGSFTVGVKLALGKDKRVFIEDVTYGRWSPKGVEDEMVRVVNLDGPLVEQSIPQDPGQAGKSQKAHFTGLLHGSLLHFSTESQDKTERARPFAAQVEGLNVFLVRASWNEAFLDQLGSYPRGAHNDMVDATSRAYARLVFGRRDQKIGVAPTVVSVARS